MIGVRGGRCSETLGSSFKLRFQFFPGWIEKSSRVALLGNEGEGLQGALLGLGCRRV